MYEPHYSPMPEPHYIGGHRIFIEGDLFHLIAEGEVRPVHARQFLDQMVCLCREHGRIAVLVNLARMNTPSPETRRVIMQSIQQVSLIGVAHYGAGRVLRTVLTLVLRGAAILRREDYPTLFCATEAEARTWLVSLRAVRTG